MRTKVKKLFKGYASVRDNIVKETIARGEDLEINYQGVVMVVPLCSLDNKFQMSHMKIDSKYGGQYELVDFKWSPRDINQEEFQWK